MVAPNWKKLSHKCDCKTGKISNVLAFDSSSVLNDTKETHHYCSYNCLNCGAEWRANSWLRGGKWSYIKWIKVKRGERA